MSDLSNILKKQYAAQQEQALAELKSAYEKNTSALDEQADGIVGIKTWKKMLGVK